MLPDNGRDSLWILFYFRQLHSGKKPAIIMTLSMRVSVNFSRVLWMMLVRSFKSDFPCRDTSRQNMAALRYHSYSLTFSSVVFLNLNMREKLILGGKLTCWTKSVVVRIAGPLFAIESASIKMWYFFKKVVIVYIYFLSVLIVLYCNRDLLVLVIIIFTFFLIFYLRKLDRWFVCCHQPQ